VCDLICESHQRRGFRTDACRHKARCEDIRHRAVVTCVMLYVTYVIGRMQDTEKTARCTAERSA
jgi:hypothetical protein